MRSLRGLAPLVCAGLSAALLAGCFGPAGYAASADEEVGGILGERFEEVLGGREADVRRPKALPPESEDGKTDVLSDLEEEVEGTGELIQLDLRAALAMAVTSGREFINQQELVYLDALGLTLTRYSFGPIMDSTISLLWSDTEKTASMTTLTGGFGISDVLPTGGTIDFSLTGSGTDTGGSPAPGVSDPLYSSDVRLTFTQPLLRGAGYEVSHESLTQGERDLVYTVRSFELFREDFTIGIANDFFDLVSQKQRLANFEQNYKDALFDMNKADALRQVDRNQDEDVFRARRQLVNAESDLLAAQTNYKVAVDSFKIRLGLSADARVEILDEEPPFQPVRLDADSAVEVALHNRLDVKTDADRLEDSRRGLRIARDGLRSDLDLVLGFGESGSGGSGVGSASPDTWDSTASLVYSLPVDRKSERNAYRSAMISLDRSMRDHQLLLDNVERDVRDQLRELRRNEQDIELQRQQIEQEQRAVAISEIRVESGEADNRELIDARQSLISAENQLIDLKARHFIARLRLLRNLGILFIDEDGMWRE
ncbi:MAG: TolC family protein [Planctomycetota bacterium]